jgi:glycosyltransferase involved in cell wall biosynthesis
VRAVFEENKPLGVRFLDKGKYDLTQLWTLYRLIKKENIHVMHLHCYGASTFGRIAGLITGVPSVIHDYDTQVYFPYPWYLWIVDRLLAPKTQGALAASPMVRDYMIKRRRIEKSNVSMMFHAVPEEKFAPVPKERLMNARKDLGLNENDRVIGTITKLDPHRGNEYLIRAIAEVVKVVPDVQVLIIYMAIRFHRRPNEQFVDVSNIKEKDKMLENLKALARELGIEKNVRFIESWNKMDEIIPVCDVIAAPFLSKRYSSVHLIEAMAMGKPLITTDIGEQREIVDDGINGYLIPPRDVKVLSEKILELLTDSEKLQKMSKESQAKARQYSVSACVESLQRLYSRLVNGRQ